MGFPLFCVWIVLALLGPIVPPLKAASSLGELQYLAGQSKQQGSRGTNFTKQIGSQGTNSLSGPTSQITRHQKLKHRQKPQPKIFPLHPGNGQ